MPTNNERFSWEWDFYEVYVCKDNVYFLKKQIKLKKICKN